MPYSFKENAIRGTIIRGFSERKVVNRVIYFKTIGEMPENKKLSRLIKKKVLDLVLKDDLLYYREANRSLIPYVDPEFR